MRISILIGLLCFPLVVGASVAVPDAPGAQEGKSPWLVTPLVSSAPKFGTSIGALGAYLKKFDQELLARIGLTGFDSNGIGLVAQRDTRDNQNSPGRGSLFSINNIAYRESFGGDASFDAYALNFSKYFPHGNEHVLAARIDGRWTHNAPPAGYSTIRLRGYTTGQYLSPHSTLVEVEERYHIKEKWGATAFVGVACLYDDGEGCGDGKNLYPVGGVLESPIFSNR